MGVLTDQVAVVTGTGSSIGNAIAHKLASLGARVAWMGPGEVSPADAGSGSGFVVDLADGEAVQAVAARVLEAFGKVNILVNTPGTVPGKPVLQLSGEEWDAVMHSQLKGVFHCVKAFQRSLLKSSPARIVNLSGITGLAGRAGQALEAASNAGLIGFTKALAREFAPRGVTVNAVAPGCMVPDPPGSLTEEQKQGLCREIPLGRLGTPDDVAEVVAFLAGPGGSYLTGQVLVVDGGLVMQPRMARNFPDRFLNPAA